MSKKPYSSFVVSMWLLATVTESPGGMTVGEVTVKCPSMTKSQIKRALDALESDGYLSKETLPWGRTGKIVFRPTEFMALQMCAITRSYHDNYNS